MTSKEYLVNSHILLKYFELVFFWLQLVIVSDDHLSELWKKEKGVLFMKQRVYQGYCDTWRCDSVHVCAVSFIIVVFGLKEILHVDTL